MPEQKEHKETPTPSELSPKWLGKLQLNSWEPEILLSGIVLYGMFQTPELLDEALVWLKVNFASSTSDLDNLIALLKVAIYWLILGLILHLISRGIWVGMIGLSFTFPKGINFKNLVLSPRFQDHLKSIPSMQSIIISLEKLCSALFSISFMLFMSMIGGYFYFLLLIIIPVLLYVFVILQGDFASLNPNLLSVYVITIMVIGLVGLLDFLTLGLLKRKKWLANIYWPFYRVLGVITLSKFYRPIYYVIISNLNKWKIFVFLVLFVISSIYLLGSTSNAINISDGFSRIEIWNDNFETSAYHGYYDDQNQDSYSLRAQIQSDLIKGNTLRLFVVARVDLEDSIRKYCNYDALLNELDTARKYIDLHCVDKFFKVYIDDSIITNLSWNFHYKSATKQRGILTWIGIRELPEGPHTLTISGPAEMYSWRFAVIPFYREFYANAYVPDYPVIPPNDDKDYLKLKPIMPK